MRDARKEPWSKGKPKWVLYKDIESVMIEQKFIQYALGKTKDPILVLNEDY